MTENSVKTPNGKEPHNLNDKTTQSSCSTFAHVTVSLLIQFLQIHGIRSQQAHCISGMPSCTAAQQVGYLCAQSIALSVV